MWVNQRGPPNYGRLTPERMVRTMTQTRAEPHVGQVIPPRAWTITPEMVATYRGGLGVEPRPGVPQMLANAAETTLLFSQQRGHLWLRQEWEFFQALEEDVPYTVEG